jgi:hypothetical protein
MVAMLNQFSKKAAYLVRGEETGELRLELVSQSRLHRLVKLHLKGAKQPNNSIMELVGSHQTLARYLTVSRKFTCKLCTGMALLKSESLRVCFTYNSNTTLISSKAVEIHPIG